MLGNRRAAHTSRRTTLLLVANTNRIVKKGGGLGMGSSSTRLIVPTRFMYKVRQGFVNGPLEKMNPTTSVN